MKSAYDAVIREVRRDSIRRRLAEILAAEAADPAECFAEVMASERIGREIDVAIYHAVWADIRLMMGHPAEHEALKLARDVESEVVAAMIKESAQ